ncbi:MAG: thiol:disulfide interchange protein DsbA/DsbL [Gammaproteobacteria bacterium]|jgi:thiol:disulfide interchange protein DsbA
MKFWVKLAALVLIAPLVYADYDEGIDYTLLAKAQPTDTPDKIEVRELFWYGCPHCYHLEPQIEAWLEEKPDDVEFVRMPAVLGASWELLARAYYTAQLLDVEDRIHGPLFDRIHKQRKPIRNVAELKAFFVDQGISAEDFDRTFQSFAVVTKTNRARQARAMYGITGVPVLIVDGKYVVSAKMAGGNKEMLEVVDFLVAKERAASSSEALAPASEP